MTEANPENAKTTTWQDWVNRTTAVLAVLAALSSGSWGASNLRAILEQGKVNDAWAYYQADSIKAHGAEQMQQLVQTLGEGEVNDRAKSFAALQKNFARQASDKATDKEARFKDARRYEATRDRMVERGLWFEISFAALQLGVILCTIASAAKSKGLWVASIIFCLVGLAVFINGFTNTIHAPSSWYSGVSSDMAYTGTPSDTK